IDLEMEFAQEGGEGPTPYEVLLHAALVGNNMRFTRQDGVDQEWRIAQPLLDNPGPVHPYAKGSWGPAEANRLAADLGGWCEPWVASGPLQRPRAWRRDRYTDRGRDIVTAIANAGVAS